MKLSFDQICSISLGAVRATEMKDGVRLYRFTEEQEEIYRQANADFYRKSFATAGIKLYFETDSCSLFMRVNVTPGSTREYFSFDIKVNGKIVGCLNNYSNADLPQDYAKIKLPQGEFSKMFNLGEGTKKVCIYLPWSAAVEIRELSLEENAFIKPIKPAKKLLAFGDSITQGYDALHPSKRYAARLAEALDAEEINKGIGGEIFFPALAESRDDFEPDYITVAYGSNDWNRTKEEDFKNRCQAFFTALSKNYPKTPIFAITPIWRKDCMETREFGAFSGVAEDIEKIVSSFKNVKCIHGFEFVPQEEDYFGDLILHPNDSGFDHYFRNLYEQIAKNSLSDPNQVVKKEEGREDTIWYDVTEQPFEMYGFDRGENDLLSCRIPEKVAERISRGIFKERAFSVGGRVRFGTDSPYILIRVEFGNGVVSTVSSYCASYGLDLYACDESGKESFRHLFRVPDGFNKKMYISSYDAHIYSGFTYYTLNLPRNSEVKKLYIGLKKESKLTKGIPYVYAKPVIFYGSSITCGSGSSRPGNTYENFIAQKYNLNYVNLGFAGKAKGETEMAEYIAEREMEAFVCDYDHNAKRVEHLRNTHYRFYEIIRKKHPNIPYIMVSRPDFWRNISADEFDSCEEMRAVIRESFERAKAAGDENVYFIDGATLFAGEHFMSCTVDGCHPNDLGFYRMAKIIGEKLEKVCKI